MRAILDSPNPAPTVHAALAQDALQFAGPEAPREVGVAIHTVFMLACRRRHLNDAASGLLRQA